MEGVFLERGDVLFMLIMGINFLLSIFDIEQYIIYYIVINI